MDSWRKLRLTKMMRPLWTLGANCYTRQSMPSNTKKVIQLKTGFLPLNTRKISIGHKTDLGLRPYVG